MCYTLVYTMATFRKCRALSLLPARVAGEWPLPPPYQARRSHSSLGSSGRVCILQHTRPSRQSEALGEDTGDKHQAATDIRGPGQGRKAAQKSIKRETRVPGNPKKLGALWKNPRLQPRKTTPLTGLRKIPFPGRQGHKTYILDLCCLHVTLNLIVLTRELQLSWGENHPFHFHKLSRGQRLTESTPGSNWPLT